MGNININIGNFDCSDPSNTFFLQATIGNIYKNGNNYTLNYSWDSQTYDSLGMTTDVKLNYLLGGGGTTVQPYTGTLPDNAVNHQITISQPHEEITLYFEFQVNGGSACYLNRSVLFSEIIDIS